MESSLCPHSLFIVSVLLQHATATSSGGLHDAGRSDLRMMRVEPGAIGHLDVVRLVLDTAAGMGKGDREGGSDDLTCRWDTDIK